MGASGPAPRGHCRRPRQTALEGDTGPLGTTRTQQLQRDSGETGQDLPRGNPSPGASAPRRVPALPPPSQRRGLPGLGIRHGFPQPPAGHLLLPTPREAASSPAPDLHLSSLVYSWDARREHEASGRPSIPPRGPAPPTPHGTPPLPPGAPRRPRPPPQRGQRRCTCSDTSRWSRSERHAGAGGARSPAFSVGELGG